MTDQDFQSLGYNEPTTCAKGWGAPELTLDGISGAMKDLKRACQRFETESRDCYARVMAQFWYSGKSEQRKALTFIETARRAGKKVRIHRFAGQVYLEAVGAEQSIMFPANTLREPDYLIKEERSETILQTFRLKSSPGAPTTTP